MGSDAAMVNASAPALSKELGKKKRNNRTAKLKQGKLDARREQWLSQVKSKGCKVVNDQISISPSNAPHSPLSLPRTGSRNATRRNNLNLRSNVEENGGPEVLQDSDLESPINSPLSFSSGSDCTGKGCSDNSFSSHCGSSGSYSRSVSEAELDEEEGGGGGEGGLDDWEAVADALTTSNDPHPASGMDTVVDKPAPSNELQNDFGGHGILKKPEAIMPIPMAWRPDDAFRPRSLPSLSKNHSFPMNMERRSGHGKVGWINEGLVVQPSSCPICYEDLDHTDNSFCPCPCGFHLCLFCHKRILEADGRCPGCRKEYSSVGAAENSVNGGGMPLLSLRLSRSCSMSSRS